MRAPKSPKWVRLRRRSLALSTHGLSRVVMTDQSALKPGCRYKIVDIVKDAYVVLAGFENSPGGGIHWTEFGPDEDTA